MTYDYNDYNMIVPQWSRILYKLCLVGYKALNDHRSLCRTIYISEFSELG